MLYAYRSVQPSRQSEMTLKIWGLGMTNNGQMSALGLQLGYVADPDRPFGEGDAFETISLTSNSALDVPQNLEIGLGGHIASDGITGNPGARVWIPPGLGSVRILTNDYLGISYPIWMGPATVKLYFRGSEMICEWRDPGLRDSGEGFMQDTFAAPDSLPQYAGLRALYGAVGPNGQEPAVYLSEWKTTGAVAQAAPYPFAQRQGALIAGPGAAGNIRIG